MRIALDQIKPSPHPVRSSWDEDKMQELTQSIREQGLIVPIKVRPADGGYEIVYGHRRAEACDRAGLADLEAIVEGVDDTNVQIQAWIENVHREDMSALDRARALRAIKDATGWSLGEMERRGIAHNSLISRLLTYLSETERGAVPLIDQRRDPRDEGVQKTLQIKTAFDRVGIGDPALKRRVHEHAAALPRQKVREVAEAVAHAEDEAEREAILTTDPADPAFDHLVKAKAHVRRKATKQERKQREEDPKEVRRYLDAIRIFRAAAQEAAAVAEFGKFSPEAGRFVQRQHGLLRVDLENLEQALEVQNA